MYGFLKIYIMLVTKKKDYVTLDPVDDDAHFIYGYRDIMLAHFKQDLYNKNVSLRDQGNRIKFWLNFVDMGVQYLIIFMIMNITTMDWINLSAVQRYFLRLEEN